MFGFGKKQEPGTSADPVDQSESGEVIKKMDELVQTAEGITTRRRAIEDKNWEGGLGLEDEVSLGEETASKE